MEKLFQFTICDPIVGARQDARKKEEKLGRVFAGEGDVMEEYERDKVEQDALQVCICVQVVPPDVGYV